MAEREFTDAQIEAGIRLALERQDVKVIPSLIALLALQNPNRAEEIRQTVLFGLSLATGTRSKQPGLTQNRTYASDQPQVGTTGRLDVKTAQTGAEHSNEGNEK